MQFQGTLHSLQINAFDAMAPHDYGVLAATTAFGKTVVAAALIAQRARNALVLVHRLELLSQWVERLKAFLDIDPKDIGIIGGGRRKPTGIIDVALIQSLVRQGEVSDLVADYGHLVVDECHHLSAASFELVARRAKARFVLGLSATRRQGQSRQAARPPGARRLPIGDPNAVGHQPALRLLAVDARDEAAPGQHGFVLRRALGGVGPDVARPIGSIQHVFEPRPVMRGGVGRRSFANEAEAAIDRHVILVAERRNRGRPAAASRPCAAWPCCISPSRARRGLSARSWPACPSRRRECVPPDRLLFLERISLHRRRDDRRVDDLPAHRQKAGLAQPHVETREQGVDGAGLLQRLAERPDRNGGKCRPPIGRREAEKRPATVKSRE